VIFLTVIGLVVPVVGFGYATSFPPSSIGNTPPRLVFTYLGSEHKVIQISIVKESSSSKQVRVTLSDNNGTTKIASPYGSKNTVYPLHNDRSTAEYDFSWDEGPAYHFKTPSFENDMLHFAAAGDAHFGAGTNSPDETAKMIQYIADPANKFDCFFNVGDLVEMGSSNRQWREAFQALNPITSRIPIGFVPGNHDTLFTGLGNYTGYCSPDNSQLYYRTDIGKVHFLVLDIEWSAETYTAEQAAWLEDQLKSIPVDDWKIVLSHGYYYSSGFNYHGRLWADNPDTIRKLTPLFEKYKVGLVFTGHDHQLEFLQHNGVSYVTCGGFGGIPDPERDYVSPASVWYLSGQFGFADVSISGDQAAVTFRSPDSRDLKTFTVKKP
jgi:UDP-2,3-diacylglucosamine pyrophosphatase LpxH